MANLKLLFGDLETTGTDERIHGVIQIAGKVQIRSEDGLSIVKQEPFDLNLSPFPGDMVSKEALEICGVTMEDLKSPERLEPRKAKQIFTSMLCRYVDKFKKPDKFFLVGFNSTFDDRMLRALFEKCQDKYYGSLISWPPIDVAPMAAIKLGVRRLKMPNFKLATVATEVGISVRSDKLHDAMYDIELTEALFDWCVGFTRPQEETHVGFSDPGCVGHSDIGPETGDVQLPLM